ncbi:hypothetical protein LUZ61_018898 [Rhynchospora tenuis]|uniref:ADP/ATP translocase n=1 Tax=Rhynchospora tenuis TaxID=198213 RepID=A0AAD6EMC7_9POAL|nr:hypothetical protein LUZ61_018898 [Rhynchospora tenuis]
MVEKLKPPSVVQQIHSEQLDLFISIALTHPVSLFNITPTSLQPSQFLVLAAPSPPKIPFSDHTKVLLALALLNPSQVPTMSLVFAAAPSEEGIFNIVTALYLGSVPGAMYKTAAAPFEHVKLLIQNQAEMIKPGRMSEPYGGIADSFARTIKDEGILALWRRNTASILSMASEYL